MSRSGQYSFNAGFTTIHRINTSKDDRVGESLSIYSKHEFHEINGRFESKGCIAYQDVQIFNQRRAKSENNILESLKNCDARIQESMACGIDCAEELYRQREQLERTECHLVEINDNLRTTEKHIKGMSSFFGGLISNVKNKLPTRKISWSRWTPRSKHGIKVKVQDEDDNEVDELEDAEEEGTVECVFYRKKTFLESDTFEDVVDSHLSQMNNNLMALKGLAVSLGDELDSQNDLLDGLNNKTEKANMELEKQRKSVAGLLK